IVSAGNDRRYPGAHRSLADLKLSLAADQRGVANFDARNVRNRVQFSRCSFEANTQIARPNLPALGCRSCRRRRLDRFTGKGVERKHEDDTGKNAARHGQKPPTLNSQWLTLNQKVQKFWSDKFVSIGGQKFYFPFSRSRRGI